MTKAAVIGGFFGLDIPAKGLMPRWLADSLRMNSARAALEFYLKSVGARRVWVAQFSCPVVFSAIRASGAEILFYELDANLSPPTNLELSDDDWLVVVNYFGVCGEVVANAVARWGPARVIVDSAQALFSQPCEGAATIYSPRKFFGLPDGGLLWIPTPLAEPAERDESSAERCQHLIGRLAGEPERFREAFLRAEAALDGAPPRSMSILTQRLLEAADFDGAARARQHNFTRLKAALPLAVQIDIDASSAPLCFPMRCTDANELRKKLAAQRIYCPTYWPGLATDLSDTERALVEDTVHLPCDQRCGDDDIDRLISLAL